MAVKLNQGEKLLSMVSSGLSILAVLLTDLFKPELFNYALIFAIVLIALTIIVLAIKIYAQSRRIRVQEEKIQTLEDSQRLIEQELAKKEERIKLLEQLINVPFFQKWHLLYTFMWRNAISFLKNPVYLYEIHVTRKLVGTGKCKDNKVTYKFTGECVEKTNSFRFCIAGAGDIPLTKIGFSVKDLRINQALDYSVLKNSQDSIIKYVEIYFKEHKAVGDLFDIELNWMWPKTAFAKTDYFSIPNIYSDTTKRIVLDLYPTDDMKLTTVETYKFGMNDAEPKKIEHLYKNSEGGYRSIIDNPEKNADYITYYG